MGTNENKKAHRHPDDQRPTEKMDPTKLFALRIEGALRDRAERRDKAHPALITEQMKPAKLARGSRVQILTEVLDPADVISIENIAVVSGEIDVPDDERPTTAIAPLIALVARPRLGFDPHSLHWAKPPAVGTPAEGMPVIVLAKDAASSRSAIFRVPVIGAVALLFATCLRWFL